MPIAAKMAQMWLTRSFKPFTFNNEYDENLPYHDLYNLGLYVHIPFCRSICKFCPYCKVKYDKELSDKYVDALIKEIHLAAARDKKEATSLYFGGGTPALISDRLPEIVETLKIYFDIKDGIGAELHPDDVNIDTLNKLRAAGVTKISIGIQSFNDKYQSILGRKTVNIEKLQKNLSAPSPDEKFGTISFDLIFALPNQTFEDLKNDIDLAFASGANHIAIYPFIDFDFTKSTIKEMSKNKKRKLLDDITAYCIERGLVRNSIWTFSKGANINYSSMTRDNFLGFGCSATTLLKEQFKINTFSVWEYIKRVESGKLPTSLTTRFSPRQRMIYYLFWTLYSTKCNPEDFEKFFGVSLKKMYGFEFNIAKLLGYLDEEDGEYIMTPKGAFYYHYYENFYTLSYIDKMWGIMSDEAFPQKIQL